MLILDIGYLESVTEAIAIDLNGGGKAVAISGFWAGAFGSSTYTSAVAENKAVSSKYSSSASSSVKANAVSSDGDAIATAFSFSSSSG
jgi:hypothetical protein